MFDIKNPPLANWWVGRMAKIKLDMLTHDRSNILHHHVNMYIHTNTVLYPDPRNTYII